MPSREKHEVTLNIVSDILRRGGYEIQKNKPIGKGSKKQYVDILAVGSKGAIVVEFKNFKIGTPDLMKLESTVSSLTSDPELKGKEISKVIISSGTISPAIDLSKEWGIDIIDSDEPSEIETRVKTRPRNAR